MNLIIGIIAIVISAEAWRRGGNGQSLWRNPGVPITIAVAKFFILGMNWWVFLYVLLLWGAIQAFSYGLNAPIHKLWVKVFHSGGDGNDPLVEVFTRATCGLLWSLPAILFAILSGTWLIGTIYGAVATIGCGLIGGLVKDVEVSERGVGAVIALAVFV